MPEAYATPVLFDESVANWSENGEYNTIFLRAQQTYLNDLLVSRGHVLLNDVFDALGLARSKEGAINGWSIRLNLNSYISFGPIYINDKPIVLKFNVDGDILDYL